MPDARMAEGAVSLKGPSDGNGRQKNFRGGFPGAGDFGGGRRHENTRTAGNSGTAFKGFLLICVISRRLSSFRDF